MFNTYFLNKDTQQLNQINELSSTLIQNEIPTDKQQLLNYKEKLITLLSYDYNWLCAEYKNISKLIEENSAAIDTDHEQKNDDLYSKSYDLFYFQKYYLQAPLILLNIAHSTSNIAHSYHVNFGQEFIECMEIFKSKNKDILDLIKPKFKNKMYGTLSEETSKALLTERCKELPSQ